MRALVDDLKVQVAKAAEGGGEKARTKHTERGKLLGQPVYALLGGPKQERMACYVTGNDVARGGLGEEPGTDHRIHRGGVGADPSLGDGAGCLVCVDVV